MNELSSIIQENSILQSSSQAYSLQLDTLPQEIVRTLLSDALERDLATKRRVCLINLLLYERYLIREGLIARVKAVLGKGCFGKAAWKDTFYRDMRMVKKAFSAAGYQLAFSRSKKRSGYYLRGEPPLHPDLAHIISASIAEVDPEQIAIYRRLTPAERFHQGCSISDTARRAVAYRKEIRNKTSGIDSEAVSSVNIQLP